jgi:Methylase involved in ubiquinone/menaquinone biosynthesis
MLDYLSEAERSKIDSRSDETFYETPRFVTHADDAFLETLTQTYATVLSNDDRVLDVMSSWVSHLPDKQYDRVVGHGLNAAELAANDRLEEWFVQDLNSSQSLPVDKNAFDAVLCALSVQYLQYPAATVREFARVLAPGGALVVSFTNKMFPQKAIRAWRGANMDGRRQLVTEYCEAAGLAVTDVIEAQPGTDPFVAVVAQHPDEDGPTAQSATHN